MSDAEFALAHAKEQALRAQQLLENTLLNDTLNRMEATVVADWKASHEQFAREECHAQLRSIQWLRDELKRQLSSVSVAQRNHRTALREVKR